MRQKEIEEIAKELQNLELSDEEEQDISELLLKRVEMLTEQSCTEVQMSLGLTSPG